MFYHTDGAWSSWQSWGSCSEPCGGGIQSRSRTCSNPKPSLLGRYCDGTPLEMRTCNRKQCAGNCDVYLKHCKRDIERTSNTMLQQSTN